MSPYQIPLPHISGYSSPFSAGGEQEFRVHAVNDRVDVTAGTRSLTLQIEHFEYYWGLQKGDLDLGSPLNHIRRACAPCRPW